ncbi:MAG: polysaccharide pyruvyl transferase family protein [Roseovarius sp.]|nr:polysaccharide pyruvyl transferase family protein [Roseovarius sp.]
MRPRKTVLFSYQLLTNVGCEIIIRGSIAFLTRAFPDHDLEFVISSYDAVRDREILADIPNVRVVPMIEWKRYIRGLFVKTGLDRRFWTPRFAARHFRDADLFVSVGGDIYTMSGNALPRDWLGYEQFATRHGIPSIMFGANMEKFDVLGPDDLKVLIAHLRRFRVIAVRDKMTETYLADHGVTENTVVFPDPMFSLRPRCTYAPGRVETIGLNVSPILLRDFGEAAFTRLAAIVSDLVGRGYRIALLPHVYASDGNPGLDDRVALRKLHDRLPVEVASGTTLYEGPVSFSDMAREISAVDLFVGARMHSCLNSVTLGKPTFFLSYSSKARTMVDWLQSEPMARLRDRVACAAADAVTIDDILALIAAHDNSDHEQAVEIDFTPAMDPSPVWDMMSERNLK